MFGKPDTKDTGLVAQADSKELAKPSMSQMDEFEPVDQQDTIRIPRLVLVQGNSPYIKERVAGDGDIINSLSRENYGDQLEVVPIVQRKSTRIRWQTRSTGGGMLCVSRDGISGQGDPGDTAGMCAECSLFLKRKAENQEDDQWCSSNYEIVAMVRNTKEPILLTADSIKPSDQGIRDMLAMARLARGSGIRMYQKSYILKSIAGKNKSFEFRKLSCVPGNENKVLDEAEWQGYAAQAKFFKTTKVADEQPKEEGDKSWA